MYTKGNILILLSLCFWPLVADAEVLSLTDAELTEIRGHCGMCCWESTGCVEGDLISAPCEEIGIECAAPGATCDESIVAGPDSDFQIGPGYPGKVAYLYHSHCTEVAVYICVQNAVSCDCELDHTEFRGTRYICIGDPCD